MRKIGPKIADQICLNNFELNPQQTTVTSDCQTTHCNLKMATAGI